MFHNHVCQFYKFDRKTLTNAHLLDYLLVMHIAIVQGEITAKKK